MNVDNLLFSNFLICHLTFQKNTQIFVAKNEILKIELKNHEKCVLDHNALIFISEKKNLL